MNPECFVIQPISDDKFTKRYDDVYKLAIEKSGLSAYRVDLDYSVKIPIEDIESKIKDSPICLADISIDNPNVWYELGYAFASGKDVVMICDESRQEFPFDVRHKNIIRYKTESRSDFDKLRDDITEKIKAYMQNQKKAERILENPIKETDGLKPFELTLLAFIIGEQYTDEEIVFVNELKNRMSKAGFNDTAFSIGMRLLKAKGFIETRMDSDHNGYEYSVCFLSNSGVKFVLDNTHLFDLGQAEEKELINEEDNILPF